MHAPPFIPHQTPAASQSSCSRVNVGMNERLVSLGTGSAFLLNSLIGPKRTRPLSFLLAAGFLYRGYTGHCDAYQMLGIDSAQRDRELGSEHQDKEVE